MNGVVLDYLRKRGHKTVANDYYNFIEEWEQWWKNDVEFHVYHDQTGTERKMYSLGMAKRLCEDWASILYSEKDEIVTETDNDELTTNNNEFINKQMKLLKVYKDLPIAIEKMMAMGTIGAVVRVKNAIVNKEGSLLANNNTNLDIIYLSAKQIMPLRIENGKIVDVAIQSENIVKGKKEYYIEIHELKWNPKKQIKEYHISNIYLDSKGKEIKKEDIAEEYIIETETPIFSIGKPAIANPLDNEYNNVNGLGCSIFASAIDQLKASDITYNNFVMDFYLGGKKVFYNKKIMKTRTKVVTDKDGNNKEIQVPIYPDDITKQQWATYGDEMGNLKDDPMITEYNPELRVQEDKEGIQFALNLLSFKAGLGTKYYEFNGGSVVTATQYVGDRQDLIVNANKHRKVIDEFIGGICKALLLFGRILFNENVTEECIVKLVDKDGFMVDTETAKQEFRLDIAQGIRQAWEYRVKFLGEDETTAKARVENIEISNINLE